LKDAIKQGINLHYNEGSHSICKLTSTEMRTIAAVYSFALLS